MIIIGHRGAAGYAVENTLISVRKAIETGVDYVEVDIQPSRDGRFMVFHDRLLNHLTNRKGYLKDFTFKTLKDEVRVDGTEVIPTLEEVCALVAGSSSGLFVEMKMDRHAKEVLGIIMQYLDIGRFMIGSFYHSVLREIKTLNPDAVTVALLECSPVSVEQIFLDTGCDYIGFGLDSLDVDLIRRVHDMGGYSLVWTVDDPEEIKLVLDSKADGIISNYPILVMQLMSEQLK